MRISLNLRVAVPIVALFLAVAACTGETSDAGRDPGVRPSDSVQPESTPSVVEAAPPESVVGQTTEVSTTTEVTLAVVENNEGIVLSGDEVMEIVGVHFILDGDIELSGSSRLIIRDTVFEHRQKFSFEHGLEATEASQVVFERSELYTSCTGTLNWAFFDSASLLASDIVMPACNTWNFFSGDATAEIRNWDRLGATFCDRSDGVISESDDMEIELCWPSGAVVDEALSTDIGEFSFPNENDQNIDFTLEIYDSTIDGWGIGVTPGSDITIRDAPAVTVSIIVGLPWRNETVILEGLDSKLYEDQTWEIVDATLRFVNVTTYGWEPNAFSEANKLIIRDSNYSASTNNSGHAEYLIENCTVGALQTQEFVEMTVRDSVITGDVVARGDSVIYLIDSIVGGDSLISGMVRATEDATIVLINTTVEGEMVSEGNGRIVVQDES